MSLAVASFSLSTAARWAFLFLACSASLPVIYAQVDTFEFQTEEQQQRFRQLSDELRCPMCQNTNLTGSSGGVAEDLRREIHRMIMEGMTNEEIEQFMFERYGDFIFYKPRLRMETLFLWFGPLIFLVIGGAAAFVISRRAQQKERKASELDDAQREKLQALLKAQG
ncbi:MAG TPA: cytochrome c-type biogenesis protein CcmH [Gammaproteobacteria bacterium]|nr:cytochrome c-type biogenesis protein CcmH [Gammaproteobacteria bacterium]|tara:strand:- start:6197 stop:6697 length:501 start_codon:yes stop_codon:yes gene_type:complete